MHTTTQPYNRQPIAVSRSLVGTVWSDIYTSEGNAIRTYLRLPTSASTPDLEDTLERAGTWIEELTASSIHRATCTLVVEAEAIKADHRGDRWIELPLGPVASVTSIVDDDATYSSDLTVQTNRNPDRVKLPTDVLYTGDITVTYTAGYTAWSGIPVPYRTAILFAVGHLWQYREANIAGTIISEIPLSLRAAVASCDRSLAR